MIDPPIFGRPMKLIDLAIFDDCRFSFTRFLVIVLLFVPLRWSTCAASELKSHCLFCWWWLGFMDRWDIAVVLRFWAPGDPHDLKPITTFSINPWLFTISCYASVIPPTLANASPPQIFLLPYLFALLNFSELRWSHDGQQWYFYFSRLPSHTRPQVKLYVDHKSSCKALRTTYFWSYRFEKPIFCLLSWLHHYRPWRWDRA